jgi:hypothetical protein
MDSISFIDWFVALIFSVIFFVIFSIYWERKLSVEKRRRNQLALLFKFAGAFIYCFVHVYVFKQGDTFQYFIGGVELKKLILFVPEEVWHLINSSEPSKYVLQNLKIQDSIYFAGSNYFILKLAAFASLLGFNLYVVSTIFFALFSFYGVMQLVNLLDKYLPLSYKKIDFAFIYIPTIFIWGSGLAKDSIALGSLCLMIASFLRFFIFKKKQVVSIIQFMIGFFICVNTKSYLVYSCLPFLILCVWHNSYASHRLFSKRKIFAYSINFLVIALVYFYKEELNELLSNKVLVLFEDRFIIGTKALAEQNAGSKYDLGMDLFEIKNASQMLKYAPQAINVSLFRPYVTDMSSIKMLLNVTESLLTLLFACYVVIKCRFRIFYDLLTKPFILFSFCYSIIFSFFIGISSGNFGTLVRYKVPMMPFFILALLLLLEYQKQRRKKVELVDKILHETTDASTST